jgi:hypothetical protein
MGVCWTGGKVPVRLPLFILFYRQAVSIYGQIMEIVDALQQNL